MTAEIGTPPTPEATPKEKKRRWFAAISDQSSAKAAAKNGAIGGLIFAGMYVIGAIVLVFAGRSPTTGASSADFAEFGIFLIIIDTLLIALILFLSWRVSTGRGYISAALLLLWFVGEVVTKVISGGASVGWIFFYLAVGATLVEGWRGCWLGRRFRDVPDAATFD
jgi:hypothetical protein